MIAKKSRSTVKYFFTAAFIAIFLLLSAILKWLYPPAKNPVLYGLAGGVEAALGLLLLIKYYSWRIWVVLALVVSIWMGFSLFAAVFGLPCSCMGSAIDLPRGISLIINTVILAVTWMVLKKHPSRPLRLKRLLFFCIQFIIIGFITAVIYFNYKA